jgi:hypothetical protein
MPERPSEIVAEVLRRVLTPAALGTPLQIGQPFGRKRAASAAESLAGKPSAGDAGAPAEGEVRALLHAGIGDSTDEAVVRRLRALAPIDVESLGARLDPTSVRLAALAHDAIAAFHPDLIGVFGGGRRPTVLLDSTAAALAEVPPPASLREALLRHAWLGPMFEFELVRTGVKFWVGSRDFVGAEPPARLLAWPEVRRVHRTDRRRSLLEIPALFEGDTRAALAEPWGRCMACLLAATPLTDLAHADRLAPTFVAGPALASLVESEAGARLARRVLVAAGKAAIEAVALASPAIAERLAVGKGTAARTAGGSA